MTGHAVNCGCTQLYFGSAGDRGRMWGECPVKARQDAGARTNDVVEYTKPKENERAENGRSK